MENPLTWNATQKLIDNHLYIGRRPEERAQSVASALLDAGLIVKDVAEQVKDIVIDEIDSFNNQDDDICGFSSTTLIYLKLVERKLLTKKAFEDGQSKDINPE